MFFLGLFSSNLLYLIITIAYFIGFGLYSIDKLHTKISKETKQEKEIKYTGYTDSFTINHKIIDGTNKKLESNNNGSFENGPLINNIQFLNMQCTLRDNVRLYHEYYFYKFSRPPPIS